MTRRDPTGTRTAHTDIRSARTRLWAALCATLLATLLLTGCGDAVADDGLSAVRAAGWAGSEVAPEGVLRVTATDRGLSAPRELSAGDYWLHLVNDTDELHTVRLARIDEAYPVAMAIEAWGRSLREGTPLPAWLVPLDRGAGAAPKSESGGIRGALGAGTWLIACDHLDGEVPHLEQGEVATIHLRPR